MRVCCIPMSLWGDFAHEPGVPSLKPRLGARAADGFWHYHCHFPGTYACDTAEGLRMASSLLLGGRSRPWLRTLAPIFIAPFLTIASFSKADTPQSVFKSYFVPVILSFKSCHDSIACRLCTCHQVAGTLARDAIAHVGGASRDPPR